MTTHFLARARIVSRFDLVVRLNAESTTVKLFFNFVLRRRSGDLAHLPWARALPLARLPPNWKLGTSLTLAPLLRSICRLDSRTRKESVRATVKVAMEKEQRRGQEAFLQQKRRASDRKSKKSSHPAR